MNNYLMPTYARQPVKFSHGKGVRIWDDAGNEYLDALSGIAVTGIGHAHPDFTHAICDQVGKLVHTSNLYEIENQEKLAAMLCELSGMESVFFSNSGAEANEAAIKIARLYGNNKGYKCPTILVMEGSFHGRTMATLSATANKKVQAGFQPLLAGFVHIPYNDIDAVEKAAAEYEEIVAILVEPIQGEGGINIPDKDYLPALQQLCDKHDWLLMLDEIQTGNGRSGKMFAYQHSNLCPDVATLAKGLANGVPVGACLARGKAAKVFGPGNHGSTYGGNPLACRAAIAVLDIIKNENLLENTKTQSDRLLNGFRSTLGTITGVKDIRGKGLLIGIELEKPCAELVTKALDQGLLINVTAETVVRLLPPLTISSTETDIIITRVSQLIKQFLGEK